MKKIKILILFFLGFTTFYVSAVITLFPKSISEKTTTSFICSPNLRSNPKSQTENGKHETNLKGNGMQFTKNDGQIIDTDGKLRTDILFKGDGGGAEVYIRANGISYVLNNMNIVSKEIDEQLEELEERGKINEGNEQTKKQELLQQATIKTHRVDVDFLNANTNYKIITNQKVDGYSNYYYPHCKEGITHVNSYNLVIVNNMYKNIDVNYYGAKVNGLKYDIIVNPGGNPNDIQLLYTGANKIQLNKGKLQIQTNVGSLGEYMPKVYQIINGNELSVKAEYILTLSGKSNEAHIAFKLGNYNLSYPLIIDPWITYYGASSYTEAHAVTTDSFGNSITTGATGAFNFPATAGAGYVVFQNAFGAGSVDGFVVKFDQAGTRLFATFIGGSGQDQTHGITCDAGNNIIFTGETFSSNFPIGSIGANVIHQPVFGGGFGSDAFLFKLDPTGVRLFSSFYGDVGADYGIDVSSNGSDIYLLGNTNSANNISTVASIQPIKSDGVDAFVAKFTSIGTRIWATYFGGPGVPFVTAGDDNSYGITIDPFGDIYFCGTTESNSFPVLNAFQPAFGGGPNDAYLVKLSSAGNLLWSTYFGGNTAGFINEFGTAVCTDALGNVYLGGYTPATAGLTTLGAYQTMLGGIGDAFVAKFDPVGSKIWCTYLGGALDDYCTGISIDSNTGNVVVSGDTYSNDFPSTVCAYQNSYIGSEDQFLTTLTPNGQQIICSSYIGIGSPLSPNNETFYGWGGSLALYNCDAYIVGTSSATYPVTVGAWQTSCINRDATISQLSLLNCGLPAANNLSFAANPTVICSGQSTVFSPTITSLCSGTTAITYTWSFQGGIPAISSLQNPTVTYNNSGTYSVQLKVGYDCNSKDSLIKLNYISVSPSPSLTFPVGSYTNSCGSNGAATVSVSPVGTYTYNWSNGQTNQTASNLSPGIYTVNVINAAGCLSTSTVQIFLAPSFSAIPSFTNNTSCASPNGIASVSPSIPGTYTYSWNTAQTNQSITNLNVGLYTVTLTNTSSGCTATQSITIATNTILPNNSILPVTSTLTCINSSVILTGTSTTSGVTYSWSPANVNTQTVIANAANNYTLTVTDPLSSCVSTTVITITQNTTAPTLTISPTSTLTCIITTVNLNAISVGNIIVWGGGALTPNTPNPATVSIASTYTAIVTNPVNGCFNSQTISVTQNITQPTLSINPTVTLTCINSNATLSAVSIGNSVTWNGGILPVNSLNPSIINLASTYTALATNTLNGCTNTQTVAVNQNTLTPTLTLTPASTLNCANTTVTLNAASIGSSVTWSGGTLPINTVNPATIAIAGNYTATATNSINGCIANQTISVSQNTLVPTLTISPTSSLNCLTTTVALNATSAGNTIIWNGGSLIINAPNPSMVSIPGIYTVTVISPSNGCLATQSIAISQNTTQPFVNAPSNLTITCAAPSVTLNGSSATPGVTFLWNPIGVNSSTAVVIAPGNYSLVVTDPFNSCKNTAITSVVQNGAFPNITVLPFTTLTCASTSVILTGTSSTSGVSYSWSPQNVVTPTAVAVSVGNYTFSVINATTGCVSNSIIAISQNTIAPSLNISPINTLTCLTPSIMLNGTSSGNLVVWNGGSLINAANPSMVITPGSYTVISTNSLNACSTSSVVTVTQNTTVPVVTTSVSGSLGCISNSVGLNATSTVTGVSYLWQPGNITAANFTISTAGVYSLTVTDPVNGCNSFTTVSVINLPTFTSNISVLSQINCYGTNNGVIQLNASSGFGTYTITNLNTNTSSGPIINFPINLSNLAAANYSIQIVNTTSGCSQILYATINEPSLLMLALPSNTSYCSNQNVVINSNVMGGTAPYNYLWQPSNSNAQNLSLNTSTTATASIVSNLTLTVTDNNGCSRTQSLQIIINPSPNTQFLANSLKGCSPVCSDFTLSETQNIGYTYSWVFSPNFSSASPTISTEYNPNQCFVAPGNYNVGVMITNTYGCTSNITYTNLIRVSDKPMADFIFSPSPATMLEPLISFTNTSTGATNYYWDFGEEGISNGSDQTNPSYIYSQTGTYLITLIASNNFSCADTIYKQLLLEEDFVIYIPNAFTPNSDNLNDTWGPEGVGISDKDYELLVFDRWGEKIFTSKAFETRWDGHYNGQPVKNDVYAYKLKCKSFISSKLKVFNGHVTVNK